MSSSNPRTQKKGHVWWELDKVTSGNETAGPTIGFDGSGKLFLYPSRCVDQRGRQWAGFDGNGKVWVIPEYSRGSVGLDKNGKVWVLS